MPQFLKAEWKNLIMANYVIDPALLLPYLPANTEIDLYNGNAYISLVGFMFANTRILGLPVPFHINFEEVNLRFYVKYNDQGSWKRGVVFIKEIVPRPAISLVANFFYREKYCSMRMKHSLIQTADSLEISYQWRYKNVWHSLEAVTEKTAVPMLEDSEQHFIAEHYWGYSKYDDKTTLEYEVKHQPWQVFPVKSYRIECDFADIYGQQFGFLRKAIPASVFVAKGSPVAVLHKRTIRS